MFTKTLTFVALLVLVALVSAKKLPSKTIIISDNSTDALPFSSLGSFTVAKPSFINLANLPSASSPSGMIISSFAPFATDYVFTVENIGKDLKSLGNVKPTQVTDQITWPNEVVPVPANAIAGYKNLLVAAGGFLVPFKGDGAITLIDLDTNTVNKLTDTSNLFYHMVQWIDIDGDGRLDILTAGANKPLFGSPTVQLIWLRQPETNALNSTWEATTLINGPDVFFRVLDLNGDGKLELLAAEFFSNKLSVYTDLDWKNPSQGFKEIVIEANIGPVFTVEVVDLNKDGKKELLVTNHVATASQSSLYVYEVPSDLTQKFVRTTIASGFVTKNQLPGNASPGAPLVVFPTKTSKLPYILLAGDGSQAAYVFVPKAGSTTFEYEQVIVLDAKATVGQIDAGDVDGDGKAEFFVPAYETNTVYAFRFD